MTLEEIQDIISLEIDKLDWSMQPKGLYEPIGYMLSLGGKRVRPLLTLLACEMYSGQIITAIPAALAIEVFHNFTLLHDDLMDRSEMRRGMPTVHLKWDVNTAILSGDVMQIKAYQLLSQVPAEHLKFALDSFSVMACEICEGQQYDMDFEQRRDVTADEYIDMIRLKTAVLLANAATIGATIGGAPVDDVEALYDFGFNIGLAFQLKDDYLDVYGDPKTFGKRTGGDILCNKKTYMLIEAQNRATGVMKEELANWIAAKEFDPRAKIQSVTNIYNSLGIKEVCSQKMDDYYNKSLESLKKLNLNLDKQEKLFKLAESLMQRTT